MNRRGILSQPSPNLPNKFAFGTTQFSNINSLVADPRIPIFFSFFPIIFDIDADPRVLPALVVLFIGGKIDKILESLQRIAMVPDKSGRSFSGDGNESLAVSVVVEKLFPLSTLVTPNLSEAEVLAGRKIASPDEMERAAADLLRFGSGAVLVKGGHLPGGMMCDVLRVRGKEDAVRFASPKIDSSNTHGTGCTLSSAIAAFLALGHPLESAVAEAKEYVYKGIEAGKDVRIGHGHGPLNHFHSPEKMHIFCKDE